MLAWPPTELLRGPGRLATTTRDGRGAEVFRYLFALPQWVCFCTRPLRIAAFRGPSPRLRTNYSALPSSGFVFAILREDFAADFSESHRG